MNKKLVFPTEMCYNIDYKSGRAEPVLIVQVVYDAKRTQKNSNYRRRKAPYPLWWNLSNSLVLQKTQTQVVFTEKSFLLPAFQLLSSYRNGLSHYLRTNRRHSSLKQNENSPGQWFFPTDCRFKILPVFKQPKTFSEAHRTQNNSWNQQSTRSIKIKDVLFAFASHQPFIRFRFHSLHHLWKIHRRSRSRLQSSQERCAFLSSPSLLRVSYQGILAWNFKARECLYLIWISRILERMSGQNSPLYLPHPRASRFWIFRSQVHQDPRRQQGWLRHRSKNNQYYQEQAIRAAISQIQEGLGISRILLYTIRVEGASSFCGNPPAITRKRFRSTHSFHAETLCLSSICNQSSHEVRECLVFLSGESSHRNLYQRTQTRLCACQNSNEQIPSQSVLFPFTSLCLQYRQLVQTDLFTTTIPECYSGNYSHRTSGLTGKAGQIRKQKCTQTTGGVYFQTSAGSHYT